MTREGAVEVNAATGKKKRISKRIRDADFAKTEAPQPPEQAAQTIPGGAAPAPTAAAPPLPHAPGAEREQDTAAAERVLERIDGARTRKASKKAARKAQAEATAKEKSSRLQFTDEERATPELERYIRKSDKAADRLDAAKAAIPKEKKLVRERTFDEATGKGKTRLHFEEQEKPIGRNKPHNNPLSRPAQEAGIFVHNKIHSVEKDNSGVEGAHKSEELAERGAKYGTRKVKEGYEYHILNVKLTNKPISEIAEELLTPQQLEMYRVYLETSGNKPLIFGGGSPDMGASEDLSGVQLVNGTRPGNTAVVDLAKRQVGNVGGRPFWSWYGFNSRVEWCACFVSWCYNQAGKSEPRFAGCQSQGVPWFQSRGQWGARGYENIAPGDAIFFDWDGDGSADHVGLVIGTDGERVYTVEGNSGDACKIKSYPVNYGCIKGYGLMNWN